MEANEKKEALTAVDAPIDSLNAQVLCIPKRKPQTFHLANRLGRTVANTVVI